MFSLLMPKKGERDTERFGGVKGLVEFEHEYFFKLKIELNFSNKQAQQFNKSALLVDLQLDQFMSLNKQVQVQFELCLRVLYVSIQVGTPCGMQSSRFPFPSNLSHVPVMV